MKIMKKTIIKLVATILLGVLIPITSYGTETNESKAKEYNVKDYSIAYYENGEITYENSSSKIDENSVFELGSNGKVVCAYITMKLAYEGKINLDDKIVKYLDSNLITDDERISDITVRELLSHTAGFSPSYELGIDKKIYSNPGEKFRYSGVGYIYLQNVIENASGMSMEEAAKHYVFEPLKMKDSTFEQAKTVTPYINFSTAALYTFVVFILVFIILFILFLIIGKITKYKYYTLKKGFIICFVLASVINIIALLLIMSKVTFLFAIYMVIAGLLLILTKNKKKAFYVCMPAVTISILLLGFILPGSIPVTNELISKKANCAYSLKSTSKDMAVFCQELMSQYNASNDALAKEMFTPTANIDNNNSWGLGIAIESAGEENMYWHSGINPGFQSLLVMYPAADKYIVVVTNSDNGLDFAKDIAKEYLGIDGKWDIPR